MDTFTEVRQGLAHVENELGCHNMVPFEGTWYHVFGFKGNVLWRVKQKVDINFYTLFCIFDA